MESQCLDGDDLDHTCVDANTHDPNCPILHGCVFAWQARFGPTEWHRQEETGYDQGDTNTVDITGILEH